MKNLAILGVGVCASGMPSWPAARAILRGESEWLGGPLPKLEVPALAVTERRRINPTSRLAIDAAMQAVSGLPDTAVAGLPSVFASADGDGQVLATMLDALAQPAVKMSPTHFHNSVFNAPSGYWTIARRARAASTTVSAGAGSFAAGLLEAGIQVVATGRPVLLVAFDMPFPESLDSFGGTGDAFACALLLGPADQAVHPCVGTIAGWEGPATGLPAPIGNRAWMAHFEGNAAAASIPLLEAIATRAAGVVNAPYLDDAWMELVYAP